VTSTIPQTRRTVATAPKNRGANGFDLLYLRDLASFLELGGSAFTVQLMSSEVYPNIMAHELQHDINFKRRWLDPERAGDGSAEEAWLNEGLSQVAEDVAGYGLHEPGERGRVASYLYNYPSLSLTAWQGLDGNYAGAHAFMRYFLDRFGSALTLRLEAPRLAGKANFGAATGIPFDLALAQFATASLFSNEPFSPSAIFDYQESSWTPWHTQVGPAAYTLVAPGHDGSAESLRADGWRAFVTSPGRGTPVSINVQTSAVRPFYVVAVRFAGMLP
jgi:hypothetical protein